MPLPLPDETDDPLKLADWLEIYALVSADSTSSRGDLERALNRLGIPAEDIETLCSDTFTELSFRQFAAEKAYPFRSENSAIKLDGSIEAFLPYIFCLLLSYFGWKGKTGDKIFPRRLFEEIAAHAAKNFLQGDSYKFAAPRKDIPGFRKAIEHLISRMGEGEGVQDQEDPDPQDDALDVVAWRHFPDGLEGKLILYGQCATGEKWDDDKLLSLNPDLWSKYWLKRQPVQLIRAYFIPHRVRAKKWKRASAFGGIMFDRCRIAFWALSGRQFNPPPGIPKWVGEVLALASS